MRKKKLDLDLEIRKLSKAVIKGEYGTPTECTVSGRRGSYCTWCDSRRGGSLSFWPWLVSLFGS